MLLGDSSATSSCWSPAKRVGDLAGGIIALTIRRLLLFLAAMVVISTVVPPVTEERGAASAGGNSFRWSAMITGADAQTVSCHPALGFSDGPLVVMQTTITATMPVASLWRTVTVCLIPSIPPMNSSYCLVTVTTLLLSRDVPDTMMWLGTMGNEVIRGQLLGGQLCETSIMWPFRNARLGQEKIALINSLDYSISPPLATPTIGFTLTLLAHDTNTATALVAAGYSFHVGLATDALCTNFAHTDLSPTAAGSGFTSSVPGIAQGIYAVCLKVLYSSVEKSDWFPLATPTGMEINNLRVGLFIVRGEITVEQDWSSIYPSSPYNDRLLYDINMTLFMERAIIDSNPTLDFFALDASLDLCNPRHGVDFSRHDLVLHNGTHYSADILITGTDGVNGPGGGHAVLCGATEIGAPWVLLSTNYLTLYACAIGFLSSRLGTCDPCSPTGPGMYCNGHGLCGTPATSAPDFQAAIAVCECNVGPNASDPSFYYGGDCEYAFLDYPIPSLAANASYRGTIKVTFTRPDPDETMHILLDNGTTVQCVSSCTLEFPQDSAWPPKLTIVYNLTMWTTHVNGSETYSTLDAQYTILPVTLTATPTLTFTRSLTFTDTLSVSKTYASASTTRTVPTPSSSASVSPSGSKPTVTLTGSPLTTTLTDTMSRNTLSRTLTAGTRSDSITHPTATLTLPLTVTDTLTRSIGTSSRTASYPTASASVTPSGNTQSTSVTISERTRSLSAATATVSGSATMSGPSRSASAATATASPSSSARTSSASATGSTSATGSVSSSPTRASRSGSATVSALTRTRGTTTLSLTGTPMPTPSQTAQPTRTRTVAVVVMSATATDTRSFSLAPTPSSTHPTATATGATPTVSSSFVPTIASECGGTDLTELPPTATLLLQIESSLQLGNLLPLQLSDGGEGGFVAFARPEPALCNVQCEASTCRIEHGGSTSTTPITFSCADGTLRLTAADVLAIASMTADDRLTCTLSVPRRAPPVLPNFTNPSSPPSSSAPPSTPTSGGNATSTTTTAPPTTGGGAPTPPTSTTNPPGGGGGDDVVTVSVGISIHVAPVALRNVWLPRVLPRLVPQPLVVVEYSILPRWLFDSLFSSSGSGSSSAQQQQQLPNPSIAFESRCRSTSGGGLLPLATTIARQLITDGADAFPLATVVLAPGRCLSFNASVSPSQRSALRPTTSAVVLPPMLPTQPGAPNPDLTPDPTRAPSGTGSGDGSNGGSPGTGGGGGDGRDGVNPNARSLSDGSIAEAQPSLLAVLFTPPVVYRVATALAAVAATGGIAVAAAVTRSKLAFTAASVPSSSSP